MTDFSQLQELASRLDAAWTPARAEDARRRVLREAERRKQTRRVRVTLLSAAALAAAGVFGAVMWQVGPNAAGEQPTARTAPPAVDERSGDRTPDLPVDRSEVTALTPSTRVVSEHSREARVYRLLAGSVRLRVTHEPQRPLVVHAAGVDVHVIGTEFVVELLDSDQVRVAVEKGRVLVESPGGRLALGPGEERVFVGRTDAVPAEAESPPPATTSPAPSGGAATGPNWRKLAQSGEYAEAHAALKKAPHVANDPAELMLAADAARLSGHSTDAVPYLRRVLANHPGDSRTPLAAFTLGRVLLDELGRPSEAAEAFAKARASGGVLAEDALAREAQARSHAGQRAEARRLAEEYLRRYPNGRRADLVRAYLAPAP
jgi:transmembrane sensor